MNRILSKNIFQKLSFIQWNKNHIHIHTHKNIHVKRLVDNTCCFLKKTDLTIITHRGIFNILPKGKSSSDSNLIFIKLVSYSIGSLPLINSI